MASAINALSGLNSSTSSSSANMGSSAPSEEVFLQLLVAQIQNQDPLNPTDSTTFVSQLAQFSELEQVIAIRGDIEKQGAAAPVTSSSSTTANSTDNQPPTTTNSSPAPASDAGANSNTGASN